MSVKLKVCVAERSGKPYACVPGRCMWELVEYLAAQRTQVLYGYSAGGFTVTFQRLDLHAAQALLDAWAAGHISNSVYQEAGASRELCYLPG